MKRRSIFLVGLLIIVLAFMPVGSTFATSQFVDVPDSHPFISDIDWAVKKGIISGYSDGTFKPDKIATRAEFASIFYNLYGKTWFTNEHIDPKWALKDIPKNHWLFKPANFLDYLTYGIFDKKETFHPGDNVVLWEIVSTYGECFSKWSNVTEWKGYEKFSDDPIWLSDVMDSREFVKKNLDLANNSELRIYLALGFKVFQEAKIFSYPLDQNEEIKFSTSLSRGQLINLMKTMDGMFASRNTDLLVRKRK